MLRPSNISTDCITPEQIGKCTKKPGSPNYYEVVSSDNITRYDVRYSREHGFTCTCKAGQNARLCWHVKAALAAANEERAAIAQIAIEQAQAIINEGHVLTIAGKIATSGELDRVMNAKSAKPSKAKVHQPQAFSILR